MKQVLQTLEQKHKNNILHKRLGFKEFWLLIPLHHGKNSLLHQRGKCSMLKTYEQTF